MCTHRVNSSVQYCIILKVAISSRSGWGRVRLKGGWWSAWLLWGDKRRLRWSERVKRTGSARVASICCWIFSPGRRPFRETHPAVFSLVPPHDSESRITKNIVPWIYTARPKGERSVTGQKGIEGIVSHIHVVFVCSIQHTFWPCCGRETVGPRETRRQWCAKKRRLNVGFGVKAVVTLKQTMTLTLNVECEETECRAAVKP